MPVLKWADQWLSNGILHTGRVSLFADFFLIASNNYNNYIETYTTKKAVNEVRIYASQSTYYYIQQNLQYAT